VNEEKQESIKKELRVQKAKDYWRANPDILRRNRLKKYGITPDWVEERKKSQANCYAAWGEQFKDSPRFTHIHHSHRTGVALGLLCSSCNTAEGFLKTADRAYRLWQYMKQTEEADA
jgi:Recombination endonuclease VII